MIKTNRWFLCASFGALITISQALLLLHNLIDGKPYKISDPLDVFHHTTYIGIPLALILCGILTYFMVSKIESYLLPMIPVIAFPILVWSIYQAIFAWSGLDLISGSGDFSVRQSELEFANNIIQALILGCLGGLVSVGISVIFGLRKEVYSI